MADLVFDNRFAELAEIDNAMLIDLAKEIRNAFDVELTGYNEAELEKLARNLILMASSRSAMSQLKRT
ncbi:hypothetical protein Psch_03174 [Pelotomaculum schinkii]|uniref:Uncharacterized protein n=1 Tax=Pelotomaculum schinkii TaxID=78350 RepID=A0A4Y7RBC3_9FIRM|nr:hypothetical protein [Pelotomaculum schinkii]TEB06132.1 hypothetical protein Psch_03174 [Pelotomaculum schinkii]